MKLTANRPQPLIGIVIGLVLIYLVLFSPQVRLFFSGDVGLFEALFGEFRIGVEDLQHVEDHILITPALLAILMLSSSLFLRAWRWQLMLKQVGPVKYWTVFHGVNLGYLLNNVLPLRAGELLRAIFVGSRASLSSTSVFSTVVAERIFDMAGLGILFGVVTWLFPFPDWLQTAGLGFAGAVVAFLILALILAHSRERLERWHLAINNRGKIVRIVGELILRLVDGLSVLRSTTAMIHIFWSTIALWGLYTGTMKLVLDAFQLTNGDYSLLAGSTWLPAAALTVITSLGFAIPSAPGGVGTYHGAVLLGLAWFDIPEGIAVIFATVMHAMNYLTLTLWGVISLFAARLKFSDIIRKVKMSEDS